MSFQIKSNPLRTDNGVGTDGPVYYSGSYSCLEEN